MLEEQRNLGALDDVCGGPGIEVEDHEIRRLRATAGPHPPHREVQLQGRQVGEPGQPREIVHHGKLHGLGRRGTVPARHVHPANPLGSPTGRMLLEERLTLHPVGKALDRERPGGARCGRSTGATPT